MSAYEDLRERALEAWRAVESPSRRRVTVYSGTCTLAAGASETLAALRSEVEKRHLEVDVGITGCNGLCYAEPLVEIAWLGGRRVLYGKLTEDKVQRLVEDALAGDGICPDLALASLPPVADSPGANGDAPMDGVPPIASLPFSAEARASAASVLAC